MIDLIALALPYGIELTLEMAEKFAIYQRMLLSWNKRMNLTAITDPREVMEKHFLDSLMLLKAWQIPYGAAMIDIGTGAGFPGVPIKIARPDLKLTLLDSLHKRTVFLRELSEALGQKNTLLHGRAEQAAHDPVLREAFYLASARALAAMPLLCELCLPFVKPWGVFLALKCPDSEFEAGAADSAVALLGGGGIQSHACTLPSFGKRIIYLIQKSSQTPPKYPRKYKQMTKTPL